jgi:hypothetical protein
MRPFVEMLTPSVKLPSPSVVLAFPFDGFNGQFVGHRKNQFSTMPGIG